MTCRTHNVYLTIHTRPCNKLTYAALRFAATVHCGVMHATLPGKHLNFCRSRSLALHTRVWRTVALPSRRVIHISHRIACAHRPETDRPAWKERTDQARSARLLFANTQVWSITATACVQVAEKLSNWVNGALDQFDTAVMPRERVSFMSSCWTPVPPLPN